MAGEYCSSCGQLLEGSGRFCARCGAPRPQVQVQPQVQPQPQFQPRPVASAGLAVCPHCGAGLMPGSRVCPLCGRPLVAEAGAGTGAGAAASGGLGFSMDAIKAWLAELRKLGWKKTWPLALSAAFLVIYVVITLNPIPLIIAFAIAWAIRKFADQIDDRLRPLWPYRERVPRKFRMILAWVAPMVIAFVITGSPPLFGLVSWLPIIGPDGSLFVFLTAISAFVAYMLIRQPRQGVAP